MFNKSDIMTHAHYLRTLGNDKSEALKKAWRHAKIRLQVEQYKYIDHMTGAQYNEYRGLLADLQLINMKVFNPAA